jgi:predicted O-linked N-acetylglucosamine transferase (SPINDLY family)
VGVDDAASIAQAERLLAEGNSLEDAGNFVAALSRYEAAQIVCPAHLRVPLNIANALRSLGRVDDAIRALADAIAARPDHATAHYNLGSIYVAQARPGKAESAFRAALAAEPGMAEAAVALAIVLEGAGRAIEAEEALKRALAIRPDYAHAKFHLGLLYCRQDRCDEAEAMLLGTDPRAVPAGNVSGALGELYLKMGRHAQATRAFAETIRADPSKIDAGSGLLFSLNFQSDLAPEEVFREHVRIGALLTRAAGPPYTTWKVTRRANRCLRIGYVSGDLSKHPVGRFMAPVLAHHDRNSFEIHCFSSTAAPDDVTRQLQSYVQHWHDVVGEDDASVAERIHSLGIDVLVDVSGHTTHHRLGVFARQPAPVQASWLGYLNTTGLMQIDYRICDAHTDPPGESEHRHAERLARLPHTQWCYLPFHNAPAVPSARTPANGAIVFGSFNQFAKVTDRTLDLWCAILRRLPKASLVVMDVASDWARRSMAGRLAKRGVDAARVSLLPRQDPVAYFERVASVDIALDTFPYNGATTTFDTLWMGTPIIALRGDRGIARGSFSIISELRVDDLIASSDDGYIEANISLARNDARRAELRATLRERLRESPMLDAPGFVWTLERLYRGMWAGWCIDGHVRA